MDRTSQLSLDQDVNRHGHIYGSIEAGDDLRILPVSLEAVASPANREVDLQRVIQRRRGNNSKGNVYTHLGEDDEFLAGQVQSLDAVPQDDLELTVRVYLWRWIRKNSIYVAYGSQLVLTLGASNTVIPWP